MSAAIGVIVLELTLYTSESYPPRTWPWLALAGALFLSAMALLHQSRAHKWPGLARFGFPISALGLVLWIVGDTIRELQVGWGLFCVGLIPIGVAAITNRLPLSIRLLLPMGSLLLLETPVKYLLGERTGGLTIFTAFGLGWLAVGFLLFLEHGHNAPRPSKRVT